MIINICSKSFLKNSKAIYLLTSTLKQSIFGLVIPKPNVKRLLATYNLIFVKYYHAGLNNLRTPPNYGSQNWTKTDGVCVGSGDLYESSLKKSQYMLKKKRLEINLG